MYVASEHDFEASKFHEHCTYKGATITVCLSEYDHIFGMYCSVPWESEGRRFELDGMQFLFRMEENKVVRFNSKKCFVDFDTQTLIDNGQ